MAEPVAGSRGPRFEWAWLERLPAPLLAALIPALAALVVFVDLPARPLIFHVIEKLGHPGVFALIAVAGVLLLVRRDPATLHWRDYAIAFVFAVALGGGTELAQMATHRHPALADVGLDARGAFCALCFLAALDRLVVAQHRGRQVRAASVVLGVACALVIAFPLGHAAAAYANRALNYPVLFVPASPLDLYFVGAGARTRQPAADAAGRYVLRVPLAERAFSGVSLVEPSPDWRGYTRLLVDVTNPGSAGLELTVRVDDRDHDNRYDDRYNGAFEVAPLARRVISIPLEGIELAPTGRRMDMRHIQKIVLFRAASGPPGAFLVNSLALH